MTRDSALSMASLAGYTLVAALILAVINLISYRHYSRVDLTEEGIHSLSPQTRKVLESLNQRVTVRAFIRPERNKEAAAFFDRYKYVSPKFSLEIVDPDKSPAMVKKYNVTAYDTYVLETESGRREAALRLTEEEITGKLALALTGRQKKIYVLTGHGERGLEDARPMGWAGAKAAMASSMFTVEPFNWFEKGDIPQDADLLIVPGPKDDFQEPEIKRLKQYLADGGRLLFTLDPGKRPALEALMREYGAVYEDDMILDPLSQRLGFDPLVATVSSFEQGHPVAAEIKQVAFFTVARSMKTLKDNQAGADARPIGATATQSWGETDMNSIDAANPVFNDKDDLPGPLTVAVSAEWAAGPGRGELKLGQERRKGRLVAVGDSDFASNSTLAMSANKDLFLNMVSWLAESENQISIRPKKPRFDPVMLSQGELGAIFWVCVALMPGAGALAGAVALARRRRH